MNKDPDSTAPAPQPDWSVVALILQGTLNVVRLVVAPRLVHKGHEIIVVGDYVFHPKMDPRLFKATIDIACAAAGRAAAGFAKLKVVGINPEAIFSVADLAIEAVRRKTQSAIVGPNEQPILEMSKEGVIKGDISALLNQEVNGAPGNPIIGLPPDVAEQTDPLTEKEAEPEIKIDF